MASKGVNKVILIGNLGQNPEIRYMPNGNAVTNVAIATSESWRDKQTGEIKEKTEWHRVVFFGKLAEIANEYLKKGSQVYVEGSIQTRKWKDQSGQDRYTTEIVVGIGGVMQMLGNRKDNVLLGRDLHKSKEHKNTNLGFHNNKDNHAFLRRNMKKMNEKNTKSKKSVNFGDDIPF